MIIKNGVELGEEKDEDHGGVRYQYEEKEVRLEGGGGGEEGGRGGTMSMDISHIH